MRGPGALFAPSNEMAGRALLLVCWSVCAALGSAAEDFPADGISVEPGAAQQSVTVGSDSSNLCGGSVSLNWQRAGDNALFVDVNTIMCRFHEVPQYYTTIVEPSNTVEAYIGRLLGTSAILNPTKRNSASWRVANPLTSSKSHSSTVGFELRGDSGANTGVTVGQHGLEGRRMHRMRWTYFVRRRRRAPVVSTRLMTCAISRQSAERALAMVPQWNQGRQRAGALAHARRQHRRSDSCRPEFVLSYNTPRPSGGRGPRMDGILHRRGWQPA